MKDLIAEETIIVSVVLAQRESNNFQSSDVMKRCRTKIICVQSQLKPGISYKYVLPVSLLIEQKQITLIFLEITSSELFTG
jgi:hypothetical protein